MDTPPLRTVLRFLQDARGRENAPPGDHELLSALVDHNDERAFAVLVQRHGPMVLGVCRRVLHNESDAEDAFQATFLVLAKKAGTVHRGESLHSWLYKVALRIAQRQRQRIAGQKTAPLPPELPDPKVSPDALSWNEVRSALDEELQRLPEKFRAPLVLCCLSGKTRDEAAEELGWTVQVLKGRLERGRKLLQSRLRRRGVELSAALLAITVAQTAGAATVPAALVATTLTTCAPTSGVGAAHVLQLASHELRTGGILHLKLAGAALALVAASAAAVGLLFLPTTEPPKDAPTPANPFARADVRPAPAFKDVTRESGLAALVDEKYTANPKWWLSGLHLADLDGDGHLDFFMSAPGLLKSGSVAALNDGKGRFTRAAGTYPPTELRLAHDINEDGKLDLCFTYQDGGGQWWTNGSAPGALKFDATAITRDANTARRQAMIDVNRDGKVDWVRGERGALAFDFADGKVGFATGAGRLAVDTEAKSEALCLPADLDGDVHIDFLVEWGHFDNDKGTSRVYRNDGKTGFTDATARSGLPVAGLAIKGVADVNRDGAPDLIVLEDLKPEIYLNDGKGKFAKLPNAFAGMEAATAPVAASWGVAVVTDFDNDGLPDILWNGKHFLWVLRGTGGGAFEYANAKWGIADVSVASVDDGHCFGDINGDGLLDIIGYTSTSAQHRFAVYQNALPRDNNWLRVRPVGAPGNKGATGAKVTITAPQTGKLLWSEQIANYNSQSAQSYYSHAETERHYGLGRLDRVDVQVEFYPSGKRVEKKGVRANGTVTVSEGDAPK